MKKFGERLKELRQKNGISKSALAKNIGINSRTVSCWENGVSKTTARYIVRLAKYFNISADYILGLEN